MIVTGKTFIQGIPIVNYYINHQRSKYMHTHTFKIFFICIFTHLMLFPFQIWGFGQNKVQYTPLTWSVSASKHFNVYFHQNLNTLPEISNRWIEDSYVSLSKSFGFSHKKPIPLIIYGNPTLFAQTNIISEILPDGVGGFTEFFKTRIAIPFNGSYNELRHVLHHELVHAFIFGMMFDQFGGSLFNDLQIPLWFNEGLAEYLSSGWNTEADMFMLEQTLNSTVPLPGPHLSGYMAYKGGQSFLFFLHSSRGDTAFAQFLREFRKSRNVSNSMEKIYKKPLEALGKEWQKELKRLYWPEIGKREDPLKISKAVTSHIKDRDHFNLRPKLSPDGSKIAFYSDRRDYTRILITDRKGKIIQEISQNGYGGFFESFHPFRSGMCWSPDGTSLAFISNNKGTDEIRIVDIINKKLKKRISTGVQNISSPNWSADGNYLTFCGIKNGMSDLFLYDLQADSLVQLTESIQFEDDPHFSPDGKKIIFSILDTNGTPDTRSSAYGKTASDLASIEIESKTITHLTHTAWNEKQPAYSSDGKKVIFVSDRNGLDNLYIAPSDSFEQALPLTDYIGGCSYPDWSSDGTVAFTFFANQGWDIYLIENVDNKLRSDTLAPTSWVNSQRDTTKHFFTPVNIENDNGNKTALNQKEKNFKGKKEPVKSILTDSSSAKQNISIDTVETNNISDSINESVSIRQKTDTTDFTDTQKVIHSEPQQLSQTTPDTLIRDSIITKPYRLQFTPDLVAFGLGISNYYSPAGQIYLAFSDLLGNHQITVAGDIQGDPRDYINLYTSYIYLKKRIDLGVGGYFSRDYTYASIYGDRLSHDTEYGGFFLARYPFSMFSRVDFELFGRHLKRNFSDTLLEDISESVFLPSLSYTFDNALWGITGPVNGIRATARVMVSPPLNIVTEHFASIDIDIRAYLHIAKRFVWANKFFAGASIPLGDGVSARRYLLGGNENWFSYKINESEYQKNLRYAFFSDFVTPFRGFNYIAISGSRAAVLNSEFRFPFIRELSIAWPLPIEIRYVNGAIFTDIGNAWEAGVKNHGLPLPENIYAGFGFGMRANLGIFVLRYDRGWPTDFKKVGTPINYFSLGAEF